MSNVLILLVQYLDSTCLTTIRFKLDNEHERAELIERYGVTEHQIALALKNGTLQFTFKDRHGESVRNTLINGWDGK